MSDPGSCSVVETRDAALAVILVRRGVGAEASRALQAYCDLPLPAPGRLAAGGGLVVLWQGPGRYLVVRERAGSGLAPDLAPVLSRVAHVVEASSSRVIFTIEGDGADEMLSKILPIDLHPRAFRAGSVALTVAGHIDVLVWREERCVRLTCAASFARSLRAQLG